MFLDIASFYIGTFLVFLTTYLLARSQKTVSDLSRYLLILMLFLFLLFTYSNPAMGIFSDVVRQWNVSKISVF